MLAISAAFLCGESHEGCGESHEGCGESHEGCGESHEGASTSVCHAIMHKEHCMIKTLVADEWLQLIVSPDCWAAWMHS